MHVELLLHPDWILPVDATDSRLDRYSLAVDQGRIVAMLPRAQAEAELQANQTLALPGQVLIPGLINAHTHTPMSLLRGLADDLPLMTWLNDHIWPAEARWVDRQFVADGSQLAILEMLRGGVTCFNDMYFFAEDTAAVADAAGIRALAGLILIDFPTRYAASPSDYLHQGLALHDSYRDHPRVRTAFAPHAPYTVSDEPLARMQTLAAELNLPVHIHVHETAHEVEESLRLHGKRPLERLDALGLLGPQLIAIHMTQLLETEIARLAETDTQVVHCPESNLKLASGFCPVARLLDAGVNVALGTDGAASNNDLDLFSEMRTAALLAKGVSGEASAVPAASALRMATINGAKALGLDEEIGSLEVGKAADLVAVDLGHAHTQPIYDPCSQVVYAAGHHQVRQVWIAGEQVIRDGDPTRMDAEQTIAAARDWQQRIAAADRENAAA